MQLLPYLFFVLAPLLAQESEEDRAKVEAERAAKEAQQKAQEAERAADDVKREVMNYEERAEELRRVAEQRSKWGMSAEELRKLLDELRSKNEAKREEAMEALKRVNARLDELLPIIAEALEKAQQHARGVEFELAHAIEPTTLYLGYAGSEVISGSADGTEYKLKSLGDGQYELHATKRDAGGKVMEETDAKGTLKELQEKYAFLKAGLAINVPASPAMPGLRARAFRLAPQVVLATDVAAVGHFVAWDGGGRVGVAVVAPSEDLRFHLELPEGAGFIVKDVVAGSRAEQIGIRRMDILLRLDGELIDSPVQLKKLHEKKGVLEIIRRSETRKIDLATIAEEKPAEAPLDMPAEPDRDR